MRVALVHDWLTGMRGGERVLESLVGLFPTADIFTLVHIPGSVAPAIEARPIRTSFIQRLPGAPRRFRQYLPLFPLAVRRFDWSIRDGEAPRRRLAGVHFERVLGVRTRGIAPGQDSEAALSLLAVTFEPGDAPSGTVTLIFSGGAAIRLDVECIEVRMKDLGPVWETESLPAHAADAQPGESPSLGVAPR